jgi:hypothetical protein
MCLLGRAAMTILSPLVTNIPLQRCTVNALQCTCAFSYAFSHFFRVIICPDIAVLVHGYEKYSIPRQYCSSSIMTGAGRGLFPTVVVMALPGTDSRMMCLIVCPAILPLLFLMGSVVRPVLVPLPRLVFVIPQFLGLSSAFPVLRNPLLIQLSFQFSTLVQSGCVCHRECRDYCGKPEEGASELRVFGTYS